jgi:L-fucose mutarotase
MLKGIDPLLGPELLATLRSMGHGDEIALVDANFPAHAANARVIRLDGVSTTRALNAVLSVMPLDDFVPEAAWRMAVVDNPAQEPPIFDEFRRTIARHAGPQVRLAVLERFAFYERARSAFAVVATGEPRLYGNLLLKKGIIPPAGEPSR